MTYDSASKSMAQVLKVVRNAERAVQRNTQVIKWLELRISINDFA